MFLKSLIASFFQIFRLLSTEIFIKSNFNLGTYVPYIFNFTMYKAYE